MIENAWVVFQIAPWAHDFTFIPASTVEIEYHFRVSLLLRIASKIETGFIRQTQLCAWVDISSRFLECTVITKN